MFLLTTVYHELVQSHQLRISENANTISCETHTSVQLYPSDDARSMYLHFLFQDVKHYFTADLCFVLQVYSTCVPTECMSADEWLAHVKLNKK